MTESEILDLLHPKQVQLLISICIQGKFNVNIIFNENNFSVEVQFFSEMHQTDEKIWQGWPFMLYHMLGHNS
jgi:hypothetical protein